MSETTMSPSVPSKTPRLLTNRDKVTTVIVIALIATGIILTYGFINATGPSLLKLAVVGSVFVCAASIMAIFVILCLFVEHFNREPGSMKTTTWVLLLILYSALGVGSVASAVYFADLASSHQAQIDVLSTCQDNGVSADECAGVVANIGVEKDR